MIDVYQATMVAYFTDGGVIHAEHLPEDIADEVSLRLKDEGLSDRMFYTILEEEFGYTPLIRFNIHEWESANWDDLKYSVDFDIDEDVEPDWDEETVTDTEGNTQHVGAYVGVHCDDCGERIT